MAQSGCIARRRIVLKFNARKRGNPMGILKLHDLRRSSLSAITKRKIGEMLVFGLSPRPDHATNRGRAYGNHNTNLTLHPRTCMTDHAGQFSLFVISPGEEKMFAKWQSNSFSPTFSRVVVPIFSSEVLFEVHSIN